MTVTYHDTDGPLTFIPNVEILLQICSTFPNIERRKKHVFQER